MSYSTPSKINKYNAAIAVCLHDIKTTNSRHLEYYLQRGLENMLVRPAGIPLVVTSTERAVYSCPVFSLDGNQALFFKEGAVHVTGITREDKTRKQYRIQFPQLKHIVVANVPSDYKSLLEQMERIRSGEDKPLRRLVVDSGERVFAKSK